MATSEQRYDEADRLRIDGKFDEAIGVLNEVLAEDDTFELAHSALAVMYSKMGQHDEAVKHAERVCQLAPNDPFSHTAMSVTYQRAFAGTNNHQYIQAAEDAMARSRAIQEGM